MKIVLLGPAHPYRGGIAALNDRLAVQLMREGHEVVVYNFKLQYPRFLFPGKTQYTQDPAPEGVDIRRKVNSVCPWNWWRVGNELKKLVPDLLIVRYWLPFMAPALGTICRRVHTNGHTRIICIADNIVPHEKRPGDKMFTRYFVKGIDGFIAMSQEVYRDLDRFVTNPQKRLAPHPVYDHYGESVPREKALERLGLEKNYRYLLFFGFIRDYKGLDLLLEAMADENIGRRPLKLIVAGEFYGNEAYYRELIEKYGLSDRLVMHTEYIPDREINNYFGAADLIVQPYKSATQSGVTQIGYHFDKPMLVTRVGGLAEIVFPDAGYVVEPRGSAIAGAIADFYDNDREEIFVARVKKWKQKFSWSNLTKAISDLYTALSCP